jgi:hypothetical protein
VARPPITDPSVNNNLVSQNKVSDNGTNPPENPPFDVIAFLAADLTYFSVGEAAGEFNSGNCFKKNKPKKGFSISSYNAPPGEPFFGTNGPLPTDGC